MEKFGEASDFTYAFESPDKVFPNFITFDLDGTLAPTGKPLSDTMRAKLLALTTRVPVAIISGAPFWRIDRDILKNIQNPDHPMYVFSENGARCDAWNPNTRQWEKAYAHELPQEERDTIIQTIQETVPGIPHLTHSPGHIYNRESSIAWAALPESATEQEREAFRDSRENQEARDLLTAALAQKLPRYHVHAAGRATVDISEYSKSDAIKYFASMLGRTDQPGVAPWSGLHIGDSFSNTGNDAAALPTGVEGLETNSPEQTDDILDRLLKRFPLEKR